MAYFPFFADISGTEWVIIGGGRVALRKARTLLKFGAKIRVIAPDILPDFKDMPITLITKSADISDLSGADFVIAASSSRSLNHKISGFCRGRNIPVNCADSKEDCSFFFPAAVVSDDVTVAVSTSGNNPSLCRRIRQNIENNIDELKK